MTNTDSDRGRQSSIFTKLTELSAINTKLTKGWDDTALSNEHCNYLALSNLNCNYKGVYNHGQIAINCNRLQYQSNCSHLWLPTHWPHCRTASRLMALPSNDYWEGKIWNCPAKRVIYHTRPKYSNLVFSCNEFRIIDIIISSWCFWSNDYLKQSSGFFILQVEQPS